MGRVYPREICGKCNKLRLVHKRLPDGSMICWPCRRRDPSLWEPCSVCGNVRHVEKRIGKKPVCKNCVNNARNADPSTHEECCVCHHVRPVNNRLPNGGAVCRDCHWVFVEKYELCDLCGKLAHVERRTASGKPICGPCCRPPAPSSSNTCA